MEAFTWALGVLAALCFIWPLFFVQRIVHGRGAADEVKAWKAWIIQQSGAVQPNGGSAKEASGMAHRSKSLVVRCFTGDEAQ